MTLGLPKSFWRFLISHTFFAVQIILELLLSSDRFWAICFPISYFFNKTPRRSTAAVLSCISIFVLIGLFSGVYVCALIPIFNPEYENSLTCCNNYGDNKAILKQIFSVYMTAAMVIIISLNGCIIRTMIECVSRYD